MQYFTMIFNNFITKVPEYFERLAFDYPQRQGGKNNKKKYFTSQRLCFEELRIKLTDLVFPFICSS